jgi:hypothetical protein
MGRNKLKIIKWLSVVITIMAALTISLRVIDVVFSYYIFLIGHLIMTYVLFKFKDWSLFFMNMVWVIIDIVGIIKWY